MDYAEVDLDEIGKIVDRADDKNDTFWSRYHDTSKGQLLMSFWENHFEWKYLDSILERNSKILDWGCGAGHADVFLALNGHYVAGYDASVTGIEIAKYIASLQRPEVSCRLDFSNSGFPWWHYDVVWICHVLEHIPVERWENELLSVMALKVPIFISVPLGHAYDVPDHINHWNSLDELSKDLQVLGNIESCHVDNANSVIRARVLP